MGGFFGNIYCLFKDFFGYDLANYLWGFAVPLSPNNSFIGIGLLMLGISLFVVLAYYYIVDKPELNHWRGWGIFLVVNAIVNFFVGWQYVLIDYNAGKMEDLNIGESDLLCFGVSNMFLSIIVFFIFSLIFKWWSRNCPNAPF